MMILLSAFPLDIFELDVSTLLKGGGVSW